MESSACLARRGRAPVLRETTGEYLDERAAQSTDERIRDATWTPGWSVCGDRPAAASEPFGRASWRQPSRAAPPRRDSGRASEKLANGRERIGAIRRQPRLLSGFFQQ